MQGMMQLTSVTGQWYIPTVPVELDTGAKN